MPESYSARLTQTGTANVAAFTLASTTEIVRVVKAFDSTARDTAADYDYPITTDTNNLTLIHAGDNTHYSQVYQFFTPVDAIIDKIDFNVGQGFNVSAYTNGNFRMTNTTIKIKSFRSSGKQEFSQDKDFAYTLTSMTAADNQIAVLNTSWDTPIPIFSQGLLEIYFDIFAATGTGTWQKGIIPIFPYQNIGGIREYGTSQLVIYLRPNPYQVGSVMYPATFANVDQDPAPQVGGQKVSRGLNG